ncbi:MAG: hypothetical protein IPK08_06195 [Bacteroidetes bacterium]|nr:hypothetical protein [Bacteroidota bacterium]
MKESLENTWNHFLDRVKSPFGGTFITAWVIIHWRPVYYFFFVDSEVPISKRFEFFMKSFDYGGFWFDFWMNFWLPAFLSIIAITIYQGFSILAGMITGYFKRTIEPNLAKKYDTSDMVARERYDALKTVNEGLERDINHIQDRANGLHSKSLLSD